MIEDSPKPSYPRKQARQQRSRLLMRSVRDAAIELIRRNGAESLTASGIAEHAGIAIGSFYQYYPNAEAVLTDIYEHILDELNAEILERLEKQGGGFDLSFEDSMLNGLEVTLSLHRKLLDVHPSFYASFINQFNITDARGPDGRSWDTWAVDWFAAILDKHRHRLRHEDTAFISQLVVDVVSGAVHRFATTRPQHLEDPRVKQELYDLICRYVLADDVARS